MVNWISILCVRCGWIFLLLTVPKRRRRRRTLWASLECHLPHHSFGSTPISDFFISSRNAFSSKLPKRILMSRSPQLLLTPAPTQYHHQ